MNTRGEIGIIACEAGKPFAEKILENLPDIFKNEKIDCNYKYVKSKETHFANKEIKTEILESIRGLDVYIIQDVANKELPYSIDENIMSLKTTIDAARRSDAVYITVILPSFPYARQDKSITRECVTAALVAREIEELGVNRVITLDIHNLATIGFFRKAILEILGAKKTICKFIEQNIDQDNLIIIAPDTGAVRKAQSYAEKLQKPLAIVYKERDYSKASSIAKTILIGEVKDNDCLIVDDMIATGGTILNVAKTLKDHGAKKIYVASSLTFFDGNAKTLFDDAHSEGLIELVIGTNAVHHSKEFSENTSWYKEVCVAKYFAEVIFNLNHNISISKLLE